LFYKGRHLVVSLDQRQADKIAHHKARFSMRPAKKNEIVFETLTRPIAPLPVDRRIKSIADSISRSDFSATLVELASHPTRHSMTSHFQDAARKARDRLQSFGYQVSFQDVSIPGGTTLNIVADKRGLGGEPRSVVLVSAHLDSVNHPDPSQPEDPAAPAPGADDNGSGSAGLLEIARVLKDQSIAQDLRLILFGGEEQGLFGSTHYVDQLPASERARIKSVVNMDMIAVVNTRSPAVLLEGGDPVSKKMIAGLSSAAHSYTRLTVNTSLDPHDSDHCPFIDARVPAVLTIEGNDEANENVHSANDTLVHINHDLAMEILRMNTAFVASEIGAQISPSG
jgi:Zn-dependent M28 family amino/carboxypeptidase